MLAEKSLVDIIHERVSANALQLPVFHHVALKLMHILSKEDFSIAQVAQMIMEDQALASHVLRMANSSFFGGLSQVTTIRDAIVRLGVRQVTNIVTVVTQSQQYRSKDKTIAAYMTTMLKVLEDVQASEQQLRLSKPVILEVLQHMHVEQGAMLMQHWNIPELYVEIVRQHHDETYDTNNTLLLIVRLVDIACQKVGIGLYHDPSIVLATTSEAQALGAKEVVLAELEIMLENATTLGSLT